ncbi:MAG: hypothetical protein HYY16_14855 [Planctomycetes bacterium]|nr:hypothetical protein [Planctomycetota bacterium]
MRTIRVLGETGFQARLIGEPSIAQPQSGKQLTCLRAFQGRVYAGFGDWNENTGPILLVAYDPAAHQFVLGPTISTEAIDEMRVIGNKLFVPEVDYSGWFWHHSDVHVFDGDAWSFLRIPRAIHIFDVAEFQGRLYAAYQYNPSNVLDGMHRIAAFEADQLVDPCVLEQNEAGRIFRLLVVGDRLYAMPQAGSPYVFDGRSWSRMWAAGQRIAIRSETDGTRAVVLSRHDGNEAYIVTAQGEWKHLSQARHPVDVKFRDGAFYILDFSLSEGVILRSSDLKNWDPVVWFTSTSPATALETLDGVFYVGLGSGELWRLDAP